MEEMVLGEDYYMEDIVITGKRAEDASADTISQNYFFYYNNGSNGVQGATSGIKKQVV